MAELVPHSAICFAINLSMLLIFQCLLIILCTFGSCSHASQSSDNVTEIYRDDNSSGKDCQVFVMEKKLKGSNIGFATIAAVCIVAGFVLVFAGMECVLARETYIFVAQKMSRNFFLVSMGEFTNRHQSWDYKCTSLDRSTFRNISGLKTYLNYLREAFLTVVKSCAFIFHLQFLFVTFRLPLSAYFAVC